MKCNRLRNSLKALVKQTGFTDEYYNNKLAPCASAAEFFIQASFSTRKLSAGLKPSLIDLEALQGDKGQAKAA